MKKSIRRRYERFGVVDIPEVVQAIIPRFEEKKPKIEILGQRVNCSSLRLQTFALKGTVCSACKLKASFFALERGVGPKYAQAPYHLNLWGIDAEGKEILFTHDHTLARSLGGRDNLSNTTTMCEPCNLAKAVGEQIEKEKRVSARL